MEIRVSDGQHVCSKGQLSKFLQLQKFKKKVVFKLRNNHKQTPDPLAFIKIFVPFLGRSDDLGQQGAPSSLLVSCTFGSRLGVG